MWTRTSKYFNASKIGKVGGTIRLLILIGDVIATNLTYFAGIIYSKISSILANIVNACDSGHTIDSMQLKQSTLKTRTNRTAAGKRLEDVLKIKT